MDLINLNFNLVIIIFKIKVIIFQHVNNNTLNLKRVQYI